MLLQISYLQESDPRMAIILLGVLGLLITTLVVANIAKNGIGGGSGLSSGSSKSGHFSRWALRRTARAYGFDKDQGDLLESIFRKAGVSDPESTLANPQVLDKHFKRAYREIEKTADTESAAEESKSILFSIRNVVESAQGNTAAISSTRRLSDNLAATLINPKGETYPVRILTAKEDQLMVESPKSAVGTHLRFSKGTKIILSFYAKSSQGYRFQSKVAGTLETPRGPVLQVSHSDKIASLPNRKTKRKQTSLSCFFSLVRIEERKIGKKIEKKTIVDDRRVLGTIMDISSGGCAIKSAGSVSAGIYLKIEFDDMHDRPLAVLGRIVRTNRTGTVGGIMHLQFVKIPRKALNAINAMVYEYDPD